MIWVGIIVGVLLLLLLLIFITKLTVEIDFYHGNKDDHLIIRFFAWFKIIRYTIDVPIVELDKDSTAVVFKEEVKTGKKEKKKKEKDEKVTPTDIVNNLTDAKKVLTHIVDFHRIVTSFLNKISIKKLEWHTAIGIGDASNTGILTGVVWTIKGSMIGLISKNMKLKVKPNITVTPLFQQMTASIKFTCIFQFRIGNAILAGIKLLSFWRGEIPKFRSKSLSKLTKHLGEKSLS